MNCLFLAAATGRDRTRLPLNTARFRAYTEVSINNERR
jgi:hypothetical protein